MEDQLFNIRELFYALKKRIIMIITVTFLTTMAGVYITYASNAKLVENYTAKIEMFIGNTEDMETMHTKENLLSYNSIINYCIELGKMNDFIKRALDKHNINENITAVISGLNFTKNEKLPIVQISYSSDNKNKVLNILNSVSEEFQESIRKIIDSVHIKILEEPQIRKVYPTKKKLVLPAFVGGLLISFIIAFLLNFLDSRVRNKEEVEKILGIPVIGEIPEEDKK